MFAALIVQAVAVLAAAAAVPQIDDACYLLESARSRAIIGADMVPSETPIQSVPGLPVCTRLNKANDRYVELEVRMPPAVNARASFETGKRQLASDRAFVVIPGVGDGAYRTAMTIGTETLTYVFVLKGDKFISLTLTGFNNADLVALAKAIADQL